jgi:hypothetical protein
LGKAQVTTQQYVRTVAHARVPEVLHVDVRVLQPVDVATHVKAGAAVVSTDRAAAAVVAN